MSGKNPSGQRTGRIVSSFETRSSERVWVVAWSDKGRDPPFEIEAGEGLSVGMDVRLDGARLVRR